MKRSASCCRRSIPRPKWQSCAASTTWLPETLYVWKEKFLEGGKESLKSSNTGKALKKHAREVDTLKKIIEEYAVANDALKKTSGGSRG